MRQSLSVTYSRPPAATAGPGLILEQATAESGRVTRLDLVKALASRLYGGQAPKVDCGLRDGEFATAVLVFPYDPAMAYEIGVTWGRLSPPVISEVEVDEILQFSLADRVETKYPVQDLVGLDPIDTCWDETGGVIQDTPAAVWDGSAVTLDRKIYGSLRIRYITIRHSRTLHIPAREDIDRDFFQSVAWAAWNGGAKLLDLTVPKVRYANDDGCAYRLLDHWIVNIPDEEIRPPTTDGVDRTVRIDYCSQKVISDETY